MDKVNEKLEDLTKEFGSLYYDKEEYENDIKFELGENKGKEIGRKERSIEIAKKMLKEKLDINLISKLTELTKEEIENL